MRFRELISRLAPSAACAALVLTVAGAAQAQNNYSVSVASGTITVSAQSPWHVNPNYPWKLVAASQTIPAASFSFTDTTATLTNAPKGTATLKGGICSNDGSSCSSFTASVTVN